MGRSKMEKKTPSSRLILLIVPFRSTLAERYVKGRIDLACLGRVS